MKRSLIGLSAMLVLLSACSSVTDTSTTTTTVAPTTTTTVAPVEKDEPLTIETKPVMAGLVDRWGLPPAHLRDIVQGFVVDVRWADLQHEKDGNIIRPNALDEALAEVRELNSANPDLDLTLKLRIRAGVDAPEWAKHLDGPPVAVSDPVSGQGGTIGRFWTEAFGSAYADLHRRMAAEYDDVDELREVTISRCTTVFAEPLIRNIGDAVTSANLLAAGFSVEHDQECLRDQISAHAVWVRTRSGLALNPYQVLDPGAEETVDLDITIDLMSYCRDVLGEHCVLANNSIRWPPLNGQARSPYSVMYAEMTSFGPPIGFQTAASDRVGDLERTIEWAVERRACAIELPNGYDHELDTQQLSALDARLRSNPGCRAA